MSESDVNDCNCMTKKVGEVCVKCKKASERLAVSHGKVTHPAGKPCKLCDKARSEWEKLTKGNI